MTKTCDCIDELNKLLSPRNGRLDLTVLTTGRIYPTIMVSKIAARGKKPPLPIPTFCPFCGAAYMAEQGEQE